MKNIIFIIISVLLLISCVEEQQKKLRQLRITPIDEWFYKGHHYLKWRNSVYSDCIVHDPDCPCCLDTLSIYIVNNNDTTYVIKKK